MPKKRLYPTYERTGENIGRIGENFADILYRNFYVVSAFIDIITVPKKHIHWSRSPQLESYSEFCVEIVLEFLNRNCAKVQ